MSTCYRTNHYINTISLCWWNTNLIWELYEIEWYFDILYIDTTFLSLWLIRWNIFASFDVQKLTKGFWLENFQISHRCCLIFDVISLPSIKKISSGRTSKQYGSWFVTSNVSISYSLFLNIKIKIKTWDIVSWKLQSVSSLLWASLLVDEKMFLS